LPAEPDIRQPGPFQPQGDGSGTRGDTQTAARKADPCQQSVPVKISSCLNKKTHQEIVSLSTRIKTPSILTGTPLSTQFQAETRRLVYQISGIPAAEYLSARQAPRLAEFVP